MLSKCYTSIFKRERVVMSQKFVLRVLNLVSERIVVASKPVVSFPTWRLDPSDRR